MTAHIWRAWGGFMLGALTVALPIYAPGRPCPSGYHKSGSYCTPNNERSKPAVPRPKNATCPSGWHTSGSWCVKN